jgi:hypothetical protein
VVVGTQNAEIRGNQQRYGIKLVQLLKYRPKTDKLDENNWVVGSFNGLSADLGGCQLLV